MNLFEDWSDHKVMVFGSEQTGVCLTCSCIDGGTFASFLGDDLDQVPIEELVRLVDRHRLDARRAEREAGDAAELATHRWHVWVHASDGSDLAFIGFDDREAAQRSVDAANDLTPERYWIVDRDAS